MSKKELQKTIKEHEGFILTNGTLNLEHLLASAYDLIVTYNLMGNPNSHIQAQTIRHDILDCFVIDGNFSKNKDSLYEKVYYNDATINEKAPYSPYDVWDDVANYFQSLAPKDYYFGSLEGDASCIGFFKYNEEY